MSLPTLRGDDSLEFRKKRGAYFTPEPIARLLVEQTMPVGAAAVLEPSCGEAVFLLACARQGKRTGAEISLQGVELHPESATYAHELLKDAGFEPEITVGDFFDVEGRRDKDLVIGNPPFVRFHDHSGGARAKSLQAASNAGVELSELSSSWAPFVAHSLSFLAEGGALGMVLPAELLYTGYAAPIRELLVKRFAEVEICLIDERVFPGVQEQVLLLSARGFDVGPAANIEVTRVVEVLTNPRKSTLRRFTPTSGGGRWSDVLSTAESRSSLDKGLAQGGLVPLSEWGSVRLGAVTGGNKFFAVTAAEADSLGLGPDELVRISPPGSAHLRFLEFTEENWRDLVAKGERGMLFRPGEDPGSAALVKITAGVHEGIDQRYKCRVRTPWWKTPLMKIPDLFLTYMNSGTPQLAVNKAQVHHINSVHGVYVRDGVAPHVSNLLPLAALNSATAVDAELSGRGYGGGMLKLEPGEARNWLVPSPKLIELLESELMDIYGGVRDQLKRGDLAQVIKRVDEVVLPKLGLTTDEARNLGTERKTLYLRRAGRSKEPE